MASSSEPTHGGASNPTNQPALEPTQVWRSEKAPISPKVLRASIPPTYISFKLDLIFIMSYLNVIVAFQTSTEMLFDTKFFICIFPAAPRTEIQNVTDVCSRGSKAYIYIDQTYSILARL